MVLCNSKPPAEIILLDYLEWPGPPGLQRQDIPKDSRLPSRSQGPDLSLGKVKFFTKWQGFMSTNPIVGVLGTPLQLPLCGAVGQYSF